MRFAELGISQSARSSALRRDVGGRLRLGACGGLDGEHVAGVAAALSTAGQRLLFHHTTIPYMYSYEESAVPLPANTGATMLPNILRSSIGHMPYFLYSGT